MHKIVFLSISLPLVVLFVLLPHGHVTVEGFVVGINESTILEIQRNLTDEELCGTITVEYFSGTLIDSKIDLGNREELFTVIGNDTRQLWIDNAWRFKGTTRNDTCEYSICGPSLPFNEATGTCTMLLLIDESTPSQVTLKFKKITV